MHDHCVEFHWLLMSYGRKLFCFFLFFLLKGILSLSKMIFTSTTAFSRFLARSILGFSLYVSNTTERLEGILCFKDKNFTREFVPVVFTTTCPTHGQYVIYYNERLTTVNYPAEYSTLVDIDLCEVEVYGRLFK